MTGQTPPSPLAVADDTTPPAAIGQGWQRLPGRAHLLLVLGTTLGFLVSSLVVATVLGLTLWRGHFAMGTASCALAGAATGAWLGHRRYRFTSWRLDKDGFGVRHGRLWRWETRVPGSRVQHLDIRRGPLERWFGLATLVVHTAGTRHSAVAVAGLDEADAEQLRDALARRTDDDDDADAG